MVLDYFRQISSVPRGSGYNEKISDFLVEFAKKRNLRYIKDDALNVVIYKDGKGCGDCPPLIFQGHMDMVCEKVNESAHDFFSDGIQIIEKDGYLTADGTTLGADDGIALAYMLALLDEDMPVHPPYEMVFTTDEETGMNGALAFDASHLAGRHMINLDSEEEGIFTCACAGGMTGKITLPIERKETYGIRIDVCVKNLLGGHSGTDIDKNRSNAVLLLGRLLYDIKEEGVYLIDIHGGNKDNVIPNEAYMSIAADKKKENIITDALKKKAASLSKEIISSEPAVTFEIKSGTKSAERAYKAVSGESFDKIISLLMVLPCGVHVMSSDIAGMPESSSNVGICKMTDDKLHISVSMRSQKESYIHYISDKLSVIAGLSGADYTSGEAYPGWDIKRYSPFRDMLGAVYEDITGRKPEVCSVHAGLEGGVFTEKVPGIDIVSVGPDIHDIHTVNERLDIGSAYRVYEFLKGAAAEFVKMNEEERN